MKYYLHLSKKEGRNVGRFFTEHKEEYCRAEIKMRVGNWFPDTAQFRDTWIWLQRVDPEEAEVAARKNREAVHPYDSIGKDQVNSLNPKIPFEEEEVKVGETAQGLEGTQEVDAGRHTLLRQGPNPVAAANSKHDGPWDVINGVLTPAQDSDPSRRKSEV